MTKEPLYIISGEQLDRALAYRIRVLPFMCPDERKEWERFIASCRSRPYNPDDQLVWMTPDEEEKRIRKDAINAVLDELQKWIDETHKEQEAIFKNGRYVHPRIIKAMMEQLEAVTWKIAELRQQAEGPQQGGREE